jgi:hypothetical protein
MEGNPDNDDNIAPPLTHTALSSGGGGSGVVHSVHENNAVRDLERERGSERGKERMPLGGLSAAQASSDNRQPSLLPHSLSNSHTQALPTHTTAFAPARTSNAVSTSTSRGVRAVSTSTSVRSGAEERASNATFRIFSDNPGKKKKM